MKKFLFIFLLGIAGSVQAQIADTLSGGVVVYQDYRLGLIGDQEAGANIEKLKLMTRFRRGYRLMVLNTSDKNYAYKVRTQLLQKYPDQKLYMWFSAPYIRLKFGNFGSRKEAEKYREEISDMLDGATIYLLNETVELPPGEDFDPEIMRSKVLNIVPEEGEITE